MKIYMELTNLFLTTLFTVSFNQLDIYFSAVQNSSNLATHNTFTLDPRDQRHVFKVMRRLTTLTAFSCNMEHIVPSTYF